MIIGLQIHSSYIEIISKMSESAFEPKVEVPYMS